MEGTVSCDRLESYPEFDVEEFIDLLERSGLAERRPDDEPETIGGMLERADIILTARADSLVVGISRAITDCNFCNYLSDLAVDRAVSSSAEVEAPPKPTRGFEQDPCRVKSNCEKNHQVSRTHMIQDLI